MLNVLAKVVAFFYDVIVVQKKFQSRGKVNFLGVGLIYLALFSLSFLSPTVNDIRRKPYMMGTYSSIEK